MYAFAFRNTTVNHIRGCVVKILYSTLPRFQSKMAIVWDRSICQKEREASDIDEIADFIGKNKFVNQYLSKKRCIAFTCYVPVFFWKCDTHPPLITLIT